ncbi:hypothetical protein FEM48_Zijuj12G0054100 [Ziziphus jujuba var. spinosa]|uniref:Mitochondrial import inner membrane translocase subunit TIM50 n=1 Tax=Ziziphus jujuba var. spinosa TaxID=714518 RepID=A0A978UBF2_ZIZJJ|nr:hypothetical protein FEM48_Zijuj12G0054100 [Ziziphus jujuba var. spinosa]
MAGTSFEKSIKFASSQSDDDTDYDHGDPEIDFDLSLERLNLGPKKKLLILSLHGFLIHSTHKANKSKLPKSRLPDGRFGNQLVYKRPYLDQFMTFCLERFEVGIWSSAMEHNVDGVMDCAFGSGRIMRSKQLFVGDQTHCTDTGIKCLDNKRKPLFLKELNEVWNYLKKINQRRGAHYSASDTLLIDEEPYRALLNTPDTSIFPLSYNAEDGNHDALDPKGELCSYLDRLSVADDVQAYVKENNFGQPAITPQHPDWEFYSNVLRRFGRGRNFDD